MACITCTPYVPTPQPVCCVPARVEPFEMRASQASIDKIGAALQELKVTVKEVLAEGKAPDRFDGSDLNRMALQSLLLGTPFKSWICDVHGRLDGKDGGMRNPLKTIEAMIDAVNDPNWRGRDAFTDQEVEDVVCHINNYRMTIKNNDTFESQGAGTFLGLKRMHEANFGAVER